MKYTTIRKATTKTKQVSPDSLGRDVFTYIDISSVDRETKRISEPRETSVVDAPSRARKEIKSNDVLVSTVRPNLNAVAYVSNEYNGEIASTGFCILRSKSELLDPKYLFYFTQSKPFIAHLTRHSIGAGYPAVTDNVILDMEIPLPPLAEQQRIAGILARGDRLRQLRRTALQLSEGYLQSVFLQLFGDPVTNPMGWEIRPLRNIARVSRGRFSPRPRNDPKYYGGEYPFVQTGDISRSNGYLRTWSQTLNFEGTNVSKAFDIGTVLIAIVGATIGETAILSFRSYCPDSVIGIEVNPDESQPEFIEHLLRFWKPIFHARAPETARANINLDTLRPLPTICPPYEQQVKFASVVQQVERLRSQQHEAARQADHLFATLLHRAFRGEL